MLSLTPLPEHLRSEFLRMHEDARQPLLVGADGGRQLNAMFVEHGHLFRGPYWLGESRPERFTPSR